MSQQTSRGSTTVALNPWIKKFGKSLAQDAFATYNRGEPLPSLYTGMSGLRREGLQSAEQIARGGGALVPGAMSEANKVLSGGYLNAASNPYLKDIVGRSVSAAQAGPLSGMAGSGRLGSGVMANAIADAGAETASRLYGAQYEAERQRMMEMVGMAPQLEQLAYDPSRALAGIGSEYEADTQARQQEDVRQYMWPYMNQQILQSALTGSPLAQATHTSSRGGSTGMDWGAMIGGILSPSVPGMGGKG